MNSPQSLPPAQPSDGIRVMRAGTFGARPQSGAARVFYYSYDHNTPNGGQKDTYQHVDVLNRNGIEAYALHTRTGFRANWFENETRVIDHPAFWRLYDPRRDFIVLPEDLGSLIAAYPGRKIVFNKNLYHGFRVLGSELSIPDPSLDPSVVALFCVSAHNQRHLRFAYPDKDVFLVHYDLRPDIFSYRPLAEKSLTIVTVPKALGQVAVLQRILQARSERKPGMAAELRWVFLSSLAELEVARILADSLVLVFLSVEEGLPRLPLEAMASGCALAAYRHAPLDEYLPATYGFEYGDLVSMAAFIEALIEKYPGPYGEIQEVAASARALALSYNSEKQEQSVLAAWEAVFRKQLAPACDSSRSAVGCAG